MLVSFRFYTFLMLTDRDIHKLLAVFATKHEFNELKFKVFEMSETLNSVVTALDSQSKILEDMRMELASSVQQLNRRDRWIGTLAENTETVLFVEG